jgi:hypothetical protein
MQGSGRKRQPRRVQAFEQRARWPRTPDPQSKGARRRHDHLDLLGHPPRPPSFDVGRDGSGNAHGDGPADRVGPDGQVQAAEARPPEP